MKFKETLEQLPSYFIRQRKELAELFGFETRNKYSAETEEGDQFAYIAEQQKGFLGFILRQYLGHWRSFTLHVFDRERSVVATANHPFRIYFTVLEVEDDAGQKIGSIERRFSIFGKHFDVISAHGDVLFSVRSPLWRIWNFPINKDGVQKATINKKWSGILKEAFTDVDNFQVEVLSHLSFHERLLLMITAVYVDLVYFERKAR